MIKILLVEDNAIVRRMIHDILNMQDDFNVIGAVEDGLIAMALLKNGLQPEIILADLNMPCMDGVELTRNITLLYPVIKIIILTMHDKPAFLKRNLAAGARGYLLKNGDVDALYAAIRKVYAGEIVIDSDYQG